MIIYTAGSVVFKKSSIVKMFSICLSIRKLHPSFIRSNRASRVEGELCGGGWIPPKLLLGCPVFQHSVCLWNVSTALRGCLVERQGKSDKWGRAMVVRADHSGNEVMAGRATESVGGVWVDAARRPGRGGDRGGIGCVLPAVSLRTVKRREYSE